MRLLCAAAALILLLPVAFVMFLAGVVCLALRVAHIPFDWVYSKCREFFQFVESIAHMSATK